jgi:NodT family efflux transporter outer membrane factor (OMF) lipoprotein
MRPKLVLSVLLVTASCVSAPKVKEAPLDVPTPGAWTAAETPSGEIDQKWWTDFGEPELTRVVEIALTRNHDLLAAATRVDQAAAQARITGADLMPTLNAGLNGQKRKQNFIGFPIPGAEEGKVLSTTFTTYGVSLDVSWELDLWDRLGARARAGIADLQAAAAEFRGAKLSVAGQTMKAWFATAEASQQLALAEATVESFTRSTNQVRQRYESGIRSSLDLRLSLANLAGAEALLNQRRRQLDAATRQLEVLLGLYPGRELVVPVELPDTPPPIPAGIPADLIARRPDLASAERRLAASDERFKAARRDRYPRLSLTATGGTSTKGLKELANGDFSVWSLAFNLLQPIFQGGRLRAAADLSEAQADEALINYASSALRAYSEVETALAAEEYLAERVADLARAAQQSRAAERLSEDRYSAGLEAFITVLESQRRALQADGEWIAARRQRLENRVDLYLALGGGFERNDPLPTDTRPTSPDETETEK